MHSFFCCRHVKHAMARAQNGRCSGTVAHQIRRTHWDPSSCTMGISARNKRLQCPAMSEAAQPVSLPCACQHDLDPQQTALGCHQKTIQAIIRMRQLLGQDSITETSQQTASRNAGACPTRKDYWVTCSAQTQAAGHTTDCPIAHRSPRTCQNNSKTAWEQPSACTADTQGTCHHPDTAQLCVGKPGLDS